MSHAALLRKLRVALGRVPRAEGGAAAVEFGFIAPIIFLLGLGMFDYGGATMNVIALKEAARAGVQYAVRHKTDTAGTRTVVLAATNLDSGTLTVALANFCECPNGAGTACTATCTGGVIPKELVSVTVSQPFPTLVTYPGISNPASISASATLRIH